MESTWRLAGWLGAWLLAEQLSFCLVRSIQLSLPISGETQLSAPIATHAGGQPITTAPANKLACNSWSTGVGGREHSGDRTKRRRRNSAQASGQAQHAHIFSYWLAKQPQRQGQIGQTSTKLRPTRPILGPRPSEAKQPFLFFLKNSWRRSRSETVQPMH